MFSSVLSADTGEAERLLALARSKSQAGREALYKNVWDLFENRSGSLGPAERALMTDILRQLSHEVEQEVRRHVAERLAHMEDAPHDLARLLAHDEAGEVAYPILKESRVLLDIDLVEVVRQRSQRHRMAVALREGLEGSVCQAIADSGDREAVAVMLGNHSARLSSDLMATLVSASQEIPDYHEPLLHRPDLPPVLARRMYVWVSAALRRHIVEHYPVDPDAIDDVLSGAIEEEVGTEAEEPLDERYAKLVDKLAEAGELGPGFLIKALREGQVALFEIAFARLVGLRPRLMRRILYEPGGEALAIAARALDLDPAIFLTLFLATRKARGGDSAAETAVQEQMRAFYDTLTPQAAQTVVRKWRRNHEYLAALKQMGVER